MVRVTSATDELAWLGRPEGPELFAGIDASGWEASCWVLSAIYVNGSVRSAVTHDDVRKAEIARGIREPLIINGLNMGERSILQGGGLGYAPRPDSSWTRVPWSEYLPELSRVARRSEVPPCSRWFGEGSWPANVEPPPEGSLDQDSLTALLTTLAKQCDGAETQVFAFYAAGASRDPEGEEDHVWIGPIAAIPELVRKYEFTPSNVWPEDRSWFVYTDYDLWATKISGPNSLVNAVRSTAGLETIEWPSSPASP
jgi:hypothetical protein